MRELALHARRLAETGGLRVVLDGLTGRGPYERRIALHMAMTVREIPYLERVLAGPDMTLRRAALRAVRTLPVSDDAAAAVLEDAPADLRRAFYRTLRHARRSALADRLLPEVRARWGDREAAALLPACPGETAARLLPDLGHAVTDWRSLAERHPEVFLAHAREHAGEWSWWRRCKPALIGLARRDPAGLLALLERDDARRYATSLPPGAVAALFKVDVVRAGRVLRRVLRQRWHPARAHVLRTYFNHVNDIPAEELRQLLPKDPELLREILVHVPPGRRAEVFDLAQERHRPPLGGVWNFQVLDLLPPERAAAEARRLLDWYGSVWHAARSRLADPEIPLQITAHLPYEEAVGPVREAAFGGDPRRRGLARTLLVRLTARTGDRDLLLALVTELADRTRGERDPLRRALITALASVPLRLLDEAFAAPLAAIAERVVTARDSSPDTRRALRDLADRILCGSAPPALTRWALTVYTDLVARHGAEALDGHRLDQVLPRGAERVLLDMLRPRLHGRENVHDNVVALARSLGRRAYALPDLQERLRAAALEAPEPLAREATALWLADPRSRERRAAELLDADPSAIVLPPVWRIVASHRTDLLDTALDRLADPERGGRFETAGWVPDVHPQVPGRWTPSQVERVRAVLNEAARDETRQVDARIRAVSGLGRLPGGLGDLASWAEREDEPALAEAALEAMAAADRPAEALGLLLAHARGPHSAVTVAALGPCAAAIPPSRLAPVLREALMDPDAKVTVRKEAARLMERLRVPGAIDALLRAWEDPGLHRDVRIAVASALRHEPGDPRVIAALGDAAGPYASELMLRTLCQATPWDCAPAHRPAYAALVRRLVAAADGPGVRFRTAKAFGAWAPWYEEGLDDIITAVADPDDPAGEDGLPVLQDLVRAGSVGEEALDVLSRLLAADMNDRSRSRVTELARTFAHLRPGERNAPLARRVPGMLAEHPLYIAQAVDAALALTRFTEDDADPERIAEEFAGIADLLRGRPFLVAKLEMRLHTALGGYRMRSAGGAERFLPAARRLTARGDVASQLLAVQVVQSAGPAAGWPGEWRDVLDELRRSRHVEVTQSAWDVRPDPDGGPA